MARQQKGQKEKAQPNNSQYKTKDKRQKKKTKEELQEMAQTVEDKRKR